MQLPSNFIKLFAKITQISSNKALKSESISKDKSGLSLNKEPIMNIQYQKYNTASNIT